MKARIDIEQQAHNQRFIWCIRIAKNGRHGYAVVSPNPMFVGERDYDAALRDARRVAKQLGLTIEE